MIKVLVRREKYSHLPLSLEIKGHALFAPSGEDIVCAGVSTLSQTIIFSLQNLLHIDPPLKIREGYMFISFPADLQTSQKQQVELLFETLLLGLKEISREYPEFITYNEFLVKGENRGK